MTAMTLAHHVSRERSAADRGRAFGRAQREAVHNTVDVYLRIFARNLRLPTSAVAAHGHRVEASMRAYRPALCDELEGIAAGAGVAPELLYAVNARTELINGGQLSGAIGRECSTVAVLSADGAEGVLGQTWDFHPDLRPSRILWKRCFPDGRWLTTFTEAGILAKIGVNSHGIALALNYMATDRDGPAEGVPVHVLVRAVLEEAATVEGAHLLVEQAPADAASCLTVAGPSRAGGVRTVALERWPGGVEAVSGSPDARSLVHTNHFLAPIAARDMVLEGPRARSSELRCERLLTALDEGVAPDVTSVSAVLSWESPNREGSIFEREDDTQPWEERSATLATIVIELPSAVLWVRTADDPALPLERVRLSHESDAA
jgi:isopenicillin-N N-acyltransferase-like protein